MSRPDPPRFDLSRVALRAAWVTGFGPFPGVDDNPSVRVALALARTLGAAPAEVLPVSWERALHNPVDDAPAIHVGVATRRRSVCIERVAYNLASKHQDADGVRRPGPLQLGAPERVVSTLPCAAIARELAQTHPARVSADPGRYLCNGRLFASLVARRGRALFVHIPPTAPDARDALGEAIGHALIRASVLSSSSGPRRDS